MQTDFESLAQPSRRGFLSLAALGSAGLLLPTPAWSFVARQYPGLRSEIAAYVAAKKAAGIVAAIGFGKERPEFISAGTLAIGSKVPMDRNSLFRCYSMTKPVTGMAAMILIGEGKMSLDQPIADFLPEFASMRVMTDPDNSLDSVPAKNPITVRHLLTHTAGLGYTIVSKGPYLKALNENGLNPAVPLKVKIPGFGGDAAPTPDLKTFSERLATLPLIAEPGTKWSYSVSLDLLGRVIEVVSGMDFEKFLHKRLFKPLKMNSTYFQLPKSEVKRFAANNFLIGGKLTEFESAAESPYLDKPAFAFGGAGLVSSARDYDRFLAMVLNGGSFDGAHIMDRETVAVGTSNLLLPGTEVDTSVIKVEAFGAGGRVGVGAQEGTFGWSGAAGTVGFIHKLKKVRATGMVQYMPPVGGFHDDFSKWVVADLGA
jgi:CubicO group peptidase (beta-lactamase class C family)